MSNTKIDLGAYEKNKQNYDRTVLIQMYRILGWVNYLIHYQKEGAA